MTLQRTLALTCVAVGGTLALPMVSQAAVYSSGHADLRLTYASGSLNLFYRLGEDSVVDGQTLSGDVDYESSALTTLVPQPSLPRPAGAAWDFTGTTAGQPLWYIPQVQDTSKPWLGISTESMNAAEFSSVSYRLTAFSGPGQLSVTTTGSFGGNTIYWQTSDGIGPADVINLSPGVHAHYNWFFTAPGLYTFDLTASGVRTAAAGGGMVSVVRPFTMMVVPEPASACVLASAGLLLLRRHRRLPR